MVLLLEGLSLVGREVEGRGKLGEGRWRGGGGGGGGKTSVLGPQGR